MRMKLARRLVMALPVAGLLGLTTAEAQVTTGTIVGTVKDPQGAAVPGATVTITIGKKSAGGNDGGNDGDGETPTVPGGGG